MIEYKGYIGVVNFHREIDLFHGTVINIQDVTTFYGASVTELREEMQKSLEVYLEVCEEQGKRT
ncbi:MAG: type II toxin-antitoxin system HicB family antitoxin [Candidatus Poribacteria bacterium]|nr:type II toxin-antitoxin system HicB family antitoxin [Candidatus Poribacteria bacterium]